MITSLSDINPRIAKEPREFVLRVEAEYHSRIKAIVEKIKTSRNIRLIFLAGPSASGKTTTSNLLKSYLINEGIHTETLSLDDYFKTLDKMPLDEFGEYDFESVYSLETEEIVEAMKALNRGESIDVPVFSFHKNAREEQTRRLDIQSGSVVIVEGLHALHPEIISHLPENSMLKLYVSVVGGYTNEEGETTLESRKIRLLRRMSRDVIYRNSPLEKSLKMWSSVVRGEDKYLCPHRGAADYEICSFHDYEICLFKGIMYQKLRDLPSSVDNYDSVKEILEVMEYAEILEPRYVPQNSLMREFISQEL